MTLSPNACMNMLITSGNMHMKLAIRVPFGLVYIINRRKRGMLLRKSKWAIYVYKVMVKK